MKNNNKETDPLEQQRKSECSPKIISKSKIIKTKNQQNNNNKNKNNNQQKQSQVQQELSQLQIPTPFIFSQLKSKKLQTNIIQLFKSYNNINTFTQNLQQKVNHLLKTQENQFVISYTNHMIKIRQQFNQINKITKQLQNKVDYYENQGIMSTLVKKVKKMEVQNQQILKKYQKRQKQINNLYLQNKIFKQEIKRLESKIRQLTKDKIMSSFSKLNNDQDSDQQKNSNKIKNQKNNNSLNKSKQQNQRPSFPTMFATQIIPSSSQTKKYNQNVLINKNGRFITSPSQKSHPNSQLQILSSYKNKQKVKHQNLADRINMINLSNQSKKLANLQSNSSIISAAKSKMVSLSIPSSVKYVQQNKLNVSSKNINSINNSANNFKSKNIKSHSVSLAQQIVKNYKSQKKDKINEFFNEQVFDLNQKKLKYQQQEYNNILNKLKENEYKKYKKNNQNQIQKLKRKNEALMRQHSTIFERKFQLQSFLMKCIEQIKKSIQIKKKFKFCTYQDFTKQDKLSLLLKIISNEQILRHLYEKIFKVV